MAKGVYEFGHSPFIAFPTPHPDNKTNASLRGTRIQQPYRPTCAVAPLHRRSAFHQQRVADRLEVGNAVEAMGVARACPDEESGRRRQAFHLKLLTTSSLIHRLRHITKPKLSADDVLVGLWWLSLCRGQPDDHRHVADGEAHGATKGNAQHASLGNNASELV